MIAVALGLAAFLILWSGLRKVGQVVAAVALRDLGDGLLALFLATVASLALGLILLIGRRCALETRNARLAIAVCLGVAVVHFMISSAREEPAPFGRVLALPPHATQVDRAPHRPPVVIATNQRGFRGPEVADRPAPQVTRIALIGDSFVFGSGVAWEDTLGERLLPALAQHAPGRAFEVVNLGIPGDNLPSHIDVYEEAVATLHPDLLILCLTMPNDLSSYDDQQLRRVERNALSYRLAEWVFGGAFVRIIWSKGKIATDHDQESFRVLDHEVLRLARLRSESLTAPPLLILSYFPAPLEVFARIEAVPGAQIVPSPPSEPGYWIPGDGHPTAAGNRTFAAQLAPAILKWLPP